MNISSRWPVEKKLVYLQKVRFRTRVRQLLYVIIPLKTANLTIIHRQKQLILKNFITINAFIAKKVGGLGFLFTFIHRNSYIYFSKTSDTEALGTWTLCSIAIFEDYFLILCSLNFSFFILFNNENNDNNENNENSP